MNITFKTNKPRIEILDGTRRLGAFVEDSFSKYEFSTITSSESSYTQKELEAILARLKDLNSDQI